MGEGEEAAVVLGEPGAARALLDGAAEAIVALDRNGAIVLVNRRTEKMFGYSRDELLGQPFSMLVAGRLRADYMANWAACLLKLEKEAPLDSYESLAVRRDGVEFPVEIRISRVRTGGPPLVIALLTDITARKRIEAELNESRQELRALAGQLIAVGEKMRKQLARDLHDVIGQKLAVVSMEIDRLRQEAAQPEQRERLATILRQVGEAAADVQRMSRQLHPSTLTDLGLPAALESECAIVSRLHGIHAVCHCGALPRLPENLSVTLYRIAQEAIRNAARHSGARRVDVSVGSDGRFVKLKIKDRGRGFDPEAVRGRAGLGLVSMRERARLVNGTAKIESKPGRGTVVEVRVPVRGASNEAGA
jgi:PAS domain S-box-containing protein